MQLRRILRHSLLPVVTLLAFTASAAPLTVTIEDQSGKPVEGMVVAALPSTATPAAATNVGRETPTAVMDQRELQFVPYILPVRTGTSVVFPNSDTTAHQVYSFSPVKKFALGLYRGRQHEPIVFDRPGIAVLGCNIHDNMIGYVYVTDAPYFGLTDAKGEWRASMPAGEYRVEIWSPRLAKTAAALDRTVQLVDGRDNAAAFKLAQPLGAAPASKPRDKRLRDY